ncbi:MAG: 30S ribosomal protein S20 [Candidatus Doudnabacteria bacterium]|nr:30S ribosomal protein S20 [Candidatus Doudnabacteria bacterium]
MPNTKSAIKAARQNIRRHALNLAALEKIKKAVKQVRKLASSGKVEDAKKALTAAYASLDKAAKKHIIHKNKASRLKSRLSKLISKVKTA